MKLSIIIPAHNEENRISRTLQSLGTYISNPKNFNNGEVEVIVVINNTKDSTKQIVRDYQEKYPVISYIDIPFYTGKGGAVTLGFQKAQGEYVAMLDADGSSSPREVKKLFDIISGNPELDGVIASRYLENSQILGMLPLTRILFSRMFNLIVRFGFGLKYKDTQCGLKIFRSKVAKTFASRIATVGWTFDLNLLIMAKYFDFNITEVPTRWRFKAGSTLKPFNALISVSKELFQLKSLELKLVRDNFIKRTFNTPPLGNVKSVMIITTDNLWDNNFSKNILKSLSKDFTVYVFAPKIHNKNVNERIGNIEFTRRGSRRTYKAWFTVYYPVFFRSLAKQLVIWNAGMFVTKAAKAMTEVIVEVQKDKILVNGKMYSLNYTNLKKNIESSEINKTILSEKFHSWNGVRFKAA